METRLAANSAVSAFIFSFLSFIILLGSLRYVPLHLTIITGLLGVIVGAALGFAFTRRRLNSLTKTGEYKQSLSTLLFFVGGMLILLSFLVFFAISAPIEAVRITLGFAYPTLSASFAAFLATEAIMFLKWERKHQKLVLVARGWWSGRLYASPKTD